MNRNEAASRDVIDASDECLCWDMCVSKNQRGRRAEKTTVIVQTAIASLTVYESLLDVQRR